MKTIRRSIFARLAQLTALACFLIESTPPAWADWVYGYDSNSNPETYFDDANADGIWDAGEQGWWLDSDSDTLTDHDERLMGTTIDNPDSDYDGIRDADELAINSDPLDWDSNDNGYSDGDEFWGCYQVNYFTYQSTYSGWTYFDFDADGYPNHQDGYPFDPANEPPPLNDLDGDGYVGAADSHEGNFNLWEDWNNNGINDSAEQPDLDSDDDGIDDSADSHPANVWLWSDWNWNGINDEDEPAPPEDSDNDGIPNEQDAYPNDFYNGDQDQDGLLNDDEAAHNANLYAPDTDGDGLNDGSEVAAGTLCNDVDTDDDGLTDYEEEIYYRNYGGYSSISATNAHSLHPMYTDYLMVDTNDHDGDTIPNRIETFYGLNPYFMEDASGDLDGNGLTNAEQYAIGIALNAANTMFDQDGDRMTDIYEVVHGLNPNLFNDAMDDPDADGVTNYEEMAQHSDPHEANSRQPSCNHGFIALSGDWLFYHAIQPQYLYFHPITGDPYDPPLEHYYQGLYSEAIQDTDGDGIPEGLEYLFPSPGLAPPVDGDIDDDGLPDVWEYRHQLDFRHDDHQADPDYDGLNNLGEYMLGMLPRVADTDNNGTLDGDQDYDGDGITNGQEYRAGTNPLLADTDGDGISDALDDTDEDGLNNTLELRLGTDPRTANALVEGSAGLSVSPSLE